MKYFAFILGCLAICALAFAQDGAEILETEATEEYFQQANQQQQQAAQAQAQNPSQSVIYVFFDNQPCQTCPQAIAMIEEVYNQNFLNNYALYTINYGEDSNAGFAQTYELSNPLEVVMVDVAGGEVQGYQKIEGLQDMISVPQAFNEYFISQVNGYLGGE